MAQKIMVKNRLTIIYVQVKRWKDLLLVVNSEMKKLHCNNRNKYHKFYK